MRLELDVLSGPSCSLILTRSLPPTMPTAQCCDVVVGVRQPWEVKQHPRVRPAVRVHSRKQRHLAGTAAHLAQLLEEGQHLWCCHLCAHVCQLLRDVCAFRAAVLCALLCALLVAKAVPHAPFWAASACRPHQTGRWCAAPASPWRLRDGRETHVCQRGSGVKRWTAAGRLPHRCVSVYARARGTRGAAACAPVAQDVT